LEQGDPLSDTENQPLSEQPVILEMRGIFKEFPGVKALTDVSIDVRRGELHALVGENGAGKSTLMKILAGVYKKDTGEIIFKGKQVEFHTPRQAQEAGIVTIYQELNQVPQMSVLENIFLGSEIQTGLRLDWKEMYRQSKALLEKLHLDIDPRQRLGDLGVGQQQMVEVAKALHMRADLIIMDEPTSSLSIREIKNLFEIIRELQEHGIAIIYISHHLEETFELADRITVLRDGQYVATRPADSLDIDGLIRLMVGRDLSEKFPKEHFERGDELLRVEGLNRGKLLRNINFSVYSGEVLGIAGLVGAGRTELVRAIFGADRIDSGRFFVRGKEVSIKSPEDAIRYGIALLTEDRKLQGLFLKMSVRDNISMAVLKNLTKGLVTNTRKEVELAQYYIDSMSIKASSHNQLAINLSGGTQQKVVLGRWMATEPRILIFDEPTRGIDVGAKVEIYRMINQLANEGVAILMVSSELPEILGMSDRILVMQGGRISGILDRAEASEELIMEYATASEKPVQASETLAGEDKTL
jgi:ribose transport system ATP-binding protein